MYRMIFNPYANNNKGAEKAKEAVALIKEECILKDITEISDYKAFFESIGRDDKIVLCGGDGTLNRFINACRDIELVHDIYICAGGNGNDFLNDLGKSGNIEFVKINEYLKGLPTVYIDGVEPTFFINGIGFGIDGYCCEEGDKLKEKSDKPVNYASIAIKGMLGGFKPRKATVTVDGKQYSYKKVWIAPTMFGRYYGGGMMPTPGQDRTNPAGTVTAMVWHDSGRIPTLAAFPSIFKGEHLKHKKMVEIFEGRISQLNLTNPRRFR